MAFLQDPQQATPAAPRFNTLEDNMALLTSSGSPSVLSQASGPGTGTPSTATGTPSTQQSTATPQSAQQTGVSSPTTLAPQAPAGGQLSYQAQGPASQYTGGGQIGKLFEPVASNVQAGGQALQRGAQDFNLDVAKSFGLPDASQAPALPTLFNTDTQSRIRSEINAGNTAGEASRLANLSYTGPSILDSGTYQSVANALAEARPRAQFMGSGPGLAVRLGEVNRGMTPGELRWDASALLPQRSYQEALGAARSDVGSLEQELARIYGESAALGQQHEGTASQVAGATRDFLRSEKAPILSQVESQVANAAEEDQLMRGALEKFMQTGRIEDLMAAPGNTLGVDPRAFNTEAQQKLSQAEYVYQNRRDEYPLIAKLGTGLGTNKKGHEKVALMDEDRADVEEILGRKMSDKEFKNLQSRVVRKAFGDYKKGSKEREIAEQLWRRDEAMQQAGLTQASKRVGGATKERGELGLYSPYNYYGQDELQLPDAREYVSIPEPVFAGNIHNLATDNQRKAINTIDRILGQADTIAESLPHTAAKIRGDVDLYLQNEERALAEREGQLTAAEKDWAGKVKHARKRYEKAKRKETYSDVARVIGNLAAPGTYEVLRTIPALQDSIYKSYEGQSGGFAARTPGVP